MPSYLKGSLLGSLIMFLVIFLGLATFCVQAQESLYPLKCGTYLVTAFVQKSTNQNMELGVAKGTEAQTTLDIAFSKKMLPKTFLESKNIFVTGKLKLTHQKHPYALQGTWLSLPMVEKYRKRDFVTLKKVEPCEK